MAPRTHGETTTRLLAGLATLPVVAVLAVIARYGVDVRYWDEWDFVPMIERWLTGQLRLADLAAPHNEHRFLFPRVVMLVTGTVTGWNLHTQMFVTPALCALFAMLLYRLSRATLVAPRSWHMALLAYANVFLFSLTQYFNWLTGMQFVFFLVPVCLAAQLVVAASWQRPRCSAR